MKSSDLNINFINLANNLNVPVLKLKEIVEKRLDLLDDLQNQQKELSYQFLEALSKSPNKVIKDIQLFYFDFEIDFKILNKSLDYFPQNSIIIGKIGDDKIRLLSLSERVDADRTLQEILRVYGGKGGGNARSAQAALKQMPEDLLSEIEPLINKELGIK